MNYIKIFLIVMVVVLVFIAIFSTDVVEVGDEFPEGSEGILDNQTGSGDSESFQNVYSVDSAYSVGVNCVGLSEVECFENSNCRGLYGSGSCSDGICTTDEVFKSCSGIPEDILEDVQKNIKLCESTNGVWSIDKFNDPGICRCVQYNDVKSKEPELFFDYGNFAFLVSRGCVSSNEMCEEIGGEWEKPVASSVEIRIDISEENCVTNNIYAILEWDSTEEHCVISRYTNPTPQCILDGKEVAPYYLILN